MSRRISISTVSLALILSGLYLEAPVAQASPVATKVTAPIVTSRPDLVSAVDTARVEHRRILVTDDETEFTTTYANPNGTFTMASSPVPVRTRDTHGAWTSVSTQLRSQPHGVSLVGSNPLNPHFANSTVNTPALVEVDPSGMPFSMRPLGVAAVAPVAVRSHTLVSKNALSKIAQGVTKSFARVGTLVSNRSLLGSSLVPGGTGSEVVYSHALGASALTYTLSSTSVIQDIVVPSLSAARGGDWRFLITAPGYSPRVSNQGILFVAPRGNQSLEIPDSVAFDSSTSGSFEKVTFRLTTGSVRGTWILDSTLPQSWLRATSRVWPITVDPSVTLPISSGTNYRSDGASAAVVPGHSQNQGAFTGDQKANSTTMIWRSVVNIPMTGLAGKHIDGVSLTLTEESTGTVAANCSGVYIYNANPSSYAGVKASAALSGFPANGPGLCNNGSTATIPSSAALVNQVQAVSGGQAMNWGFAGNESTTTNVYFKQFMPVMYVTYDSTPSAPTIVGTASQNCNAAQPNSTISYVNTLTPVLCAFSTDPDPGALVNYDVYIANSAGATIAYFQTGQYSPGSDIAFQVPTGTVLANGGTYYWYMYASNGSSTSTNSSWSMFTIDTIVPTNAGVACSTTYPPPFPAITTTGQILNTDYMPSGGLVLSCTFTGYDINMKQFTYQLNNGFPIAVPVSGSLSNEFSTTTTITIPQTNTGLQAISVVAADLAGNSSSTALWTLDVGYGMSQPFANSDASSTIPISAVSPAGNPSNTTAQVCWALASSALGSNNCSLANGWTNAGSAVTVASTGAAWTSGYVVTSPTGTGVMTPVPASGSGSGYTNPYGAPSLLLNIAQAGIATPAALEVEVCFITAGLTTCTPPTPVTVLAHGEGNAMATASIGPGTLSLSSGEFTMSGPSASLKGEGPTSDVSLSTTYSSRPAASDDNSEFGPGWTTSAPSGGGYAGYEVSDSSQGGHLPGAVILASPGGQQYQFNVTKTVQYNGSTSPTLTAVGDAYQSGLVATMSAPQATNPGSIWICTVNFSISSPDGWVTNFAGLVYSGNSQGACYGTPGSFSVASVVSPTSGAAGSWTYKNTGDPNQPLEVVATSPNSGPNTCISSYAIPVVAGNVPQGCRILSLQYDSGPAATGSTLGSYLNRVSEIDLTQWDPNQLSGAGSNVTWPTQCFLYNSSGYLSETWDPRVGLNEGATPSCTGPVLFPTTYQYSGTPINGAYPMTSVQQAGTNAWNLAYDSSGRLSSVTRVLDATDMSAGTPTSATTTVAYNVPLTGAGLPTMTSPSSWSQTIDVPTTAVAIFPADHVPSGAPTSADWSHADITYLDGYGRAVDDASYGDGAWTGNAIGTGWNVSAQQYGQQLGDVSNTFESQSNVVWSLSANGYEMAMASGSAASAATAQQEASLAFYNPSSLNSVPVGAELTDTYGPLHNMTTSGGVVLARTHTNDSYGLDTPGTYGTYTNGAAFTFNPSNGLPWQLVTQIASGYSTTSDPSALTPVAMASDFQSTSLPDYRVTTNYYGNPGTQYGNPLTFATPSQVVTNTGSGYSITNTMYLTISGQTAVQVQPSGLLTNQGSMYDWYYGSSLSGTPAACAGPPQWYGMLCETAPGSTGPSVGSPVPTTTYTYNFNLEPQTVSESVNGVTQRTINYAYDLAGRETLTQTMDAPTTGSVQISDSEKVYSPTTGLQTGTQLVTGDATAYGALTSPGTPLTVSSNTFDADGRLSSTTDANNKTTTYLYNVDSELVQTVEPVTNTNAGLSLCDAYGGTDASGTSEMRPLLTTETVVAGTSCSGANAVTYQAAYDANGNAVTLKYPNGMVATTSYNPEDQATQLAYTQGGSGVLSGYASTVMTFAQTYNPFGQVATASSPESAQVYAYDGAGRLTGVGDNFEGSCTTRMYALDGDSNRTSFTTAATTPVAGSCPTVFPAMFTTTASVFDTTGTGQGGSDRIISSTTRTSSGIVSGNYAYDVLGRQTTIPGVDTQAGGTAALPNNATLTYRSDNQLNTVSQGPVCEALSYDPLGNVATTSILFSASCSGTATTTSTNDYADSSSPAWTSSSGATTAFIDGITQGNALNVSLSGPNSPTPCLGISTATCTLNLTDMRGNIVATAALATGTSSVSGYSETTEFGAPRSTSVQAAVAPQYGWLGVHEKAANNLAGLVIMGVRMYNPVTGLFSSPDPIYGGNDNPFVYPSDPINGFDLSGQSGGGGGEGAGKCAGSRAKLESCRGGSNPFRGIVTVVKSVVTAVGATPGIGVVSKTAGFVGDLFTVQADAQKSVLYTAGDLAGGSIGLFAGAAAGTAFGAIGGTNTADNNCGPDCAGFGTLTGGFVGGLLGSYQGAKFGVWLTQQFQRHF